MQIRTLHSWWVRGLATVLAFVFLGTLIREFRTSPALPQSVQKDMVPEHFTPEELSTFGYAVSGVIESSDSITVRAQTAGVVTALSHREGSEVNVGDVLLTQEVPLLDSRIALTQSTNELTALSQNAALITHTGESESARVLQGAKLENLMLTKEGATSSSENSTSLLATQVYGAVAVLVSVLDFIDLHESYFTRESLKEFRETVGVLYGESQTFFNGPLQYRLESHDDILTLLDVLTKDTMYPDTAQLIVVATLVDGELNAVRNVLVDGESDFFDAKVVKEESTLYGAYLGHRERIVEAQATLRSRIGSVRDSLVTNEQSILSAETQSTLQEIEYATAAQKAENAAQSAQQSNRVSNAALDVLYAEGSLGMPRAPFSGVIGEVFVNEGEYVVPGTALMTLVGVGAKELRVTVPATMLPYLEEGAAFTSDSIVLGHVTRFAPVLTSGVVTVFIALTDADFVPGDILRGEIQCKLAVSEVIALPRAYLSFDSTGAYVRTLSGARVRVVIMHDTGTTLLVKPITPIAEPLMKTVGMIL